MQPRRKELSMYPHLAAQLIEIRIQEQQARAAARRRHARRRQVQS
jgi:hypothetical protein